MIGTFPGAAYFKNHSVETKAFFSGLFEWGNVAQGVRSSDSEVQARLHDGPGGKFLWVLNPTRTPREVTIWLSENDKSFTSGKDIWGGKAITCNGNAVKVAVDDRDAAVIQLK